MRRFDEYDLRVFDAHLMADEGDGWVRTEKLQRFHEGPLPTQRLSGMARRGLLRYDGFRWALTTAGIRQANEFCHGGER